MTNIIIKKNYVNADEIKGLDFKEVAELKYFIEYSNKSWAVTPKSKIKISMVAFDLEGNRI